MTSATRSVDQRSGPFCITISDAALRTMVIVSAAFRRDKHQDWYVQQEAGLSKESSSSQLDFKSQHHASAKAVIGVVATSTLTSTEEDDADVRPRQDQRVLRAKESLPAPRKKHLHRLQPQQIEGPSERISVFSGSARMPPAPPPLPPPPPLESVIASSGLMSTVSPISHQLQRSESYASSQNSTTLPAHAHFQSLRRFVVLSRSPEDALDSPSYSSYWTASSLPTAPPFPPPKNLQTNNNSKVVHPCDDSDGVTGLTTLLESITSLCVGGDERKPYRRRQKVPRSQRKARHYAPQSTFGCIADNNAIHDDEDDDNDKEDGFGLLPQAAAVMMNRQKQQQQQKQQQSRPAQWTYRKSVVYPIASYPARLNSKTLVEQRRQELKQNSFFRPISEDEMSVQQPQQSHPHGKYPQARDPVKPHHSF